jgi:hypothetical protein
VASPKNRDTFVEVGIASRADIEGHMDMLS